ncbi:protein phosphatase 2C domain-containing protein [Streptomyces niveus]|uniref:PP2C family protein-serine/threonine phosphatase n=1 Tax=Streptomyces niveus TaxID=193462 RepID=UPI0034475A11|nr:protein phosphatase 2C domain-containing protein [Streptomyces niveus]
MALTATGDWTIGVVCDGVSMSPRAERAAQVATTVGAARLAAGLREGVLPETALEDAAAHAGRAVSALAVSVDAAPACTYVAGIAGPEGIWCAWIGDSRAYWLPDEGTCLALTEDDSGQHEALTAWLGADADDSPARTRSYRPQGNRPAAAPHGRTDPPPVRRRRAACRTHPRPAPNTARTRPS